MFYAGHSYPLSHIRVSDLQHDTTATCLFCAKISVCGHYIGGSLERDKYIITVCIHHECLRMLHDQYYKRLSSKRMARFIRLTFELLKKTNHVPRNEYLYRYRLKRFYYLRQAH